MGPDTAWLVSLFKKKKQEGDHHMKTGGRDRSYSHMPRMPGATRGSKQARKDSPTGLRGSTALMMPCACCCVCLCSVMSPQTVDSPMAPGSSVHGIFLARITEWVAISSFRGSSGPRNQTHVFCTEGRFFTTEQPEKPTLTLWPYSLYS